MAVLAKLNADRCREVACIEGMKLGAAADHLIELGWHAYLDHRADQTHSSQKLGRELRRIRKQREDLLHRKPAKAA